ncbi:hypothetical protein [Desulfobacter sp.]|nr:hypothetical protein [Desulfobacter sp.]
MFQKKLSIISELRAESVTDNMAGQYAADGFCQFEGKEDQSGD